MDPWEILGSGICHLNPDRMSVGAWLCDRCVGMYLGAFVGVAHAGLVRRRIRSVFPQILLCAALILPMVVDLVFFGWNSSLDTRGWRNLTGLLGGGGWALFLALRGMGAVRWPAMLTRIAWLSKLSKNVWALAWGAVVLAVSLFYLGLPAPQNLLMLTGVVLLYSSGTAWVLGLLARCWRWARRRAGPAPRFGALLVFAIVCGELLLVAFTPSQYKPGMGWFWTVLSWLGFL